MTWEGSLVSASKMNRFLNGWLETEDRQWRLYKHTHFLHLLPLTNLCIYGYSPWSQGHILRALLTLWNNLLPQGSYFWGHAIMNVHCRPCKHIRLCFIYFILSIAVRMIKLMGIRHMHGFKSTMTCHCNESVTNPTIYGLCCMHSSPGTSIINGSLTTM